MTEGNLSDSIHSHLGFPILLFAIGVIFLWAGATQYIEFRTELADYLSLRSDNQTTFLIVTGGASIIAGFLGIIRGYLFR